MADSPRDDDLRFELCVEGSGQARQYVAWVADGRGGRGGRAAEHTFEWRMDGVALALTLGGLARAAVTAQPPEKALHVDFGKQLFAAVFGGAVGELWAARRKRARRQPLQLVLRVSPNSARELLRLPWEYLRDGDGFLALNWRTPLSRLPWGVEPEPCGPLTEALRMLVLIAAPRGLAQEQVLNFAREEDLILEATREARQSGRLELEFAPGGSLEVLETALSDFDPHILHFVGHGVFDENSDSGFLLVESAQGEKRHVPNRDFAALLARQAQALRLVFLSACQSAMTAQTGGFVDLGAALLGEGIPAVLAMQYSVFNTSAMAFGSAFYKEIAQGKALPEAATAAREALDRASPNHVDFATPVLYTSDPACLQVSQAAHFEARRQPWELGGVPEATHFVGRTDYLRDLQTHLDPEHGDWRAAVIYGLGGMGKTALATRLAARMRPTLDGVKALRVGPTTTAREVLDQLAGFLSVGNAVFNHPGVGQFLAARDQAIPLESKLAPLLQALNDLRLLLIFDNYEDVLAEGQAVSRGAQAQPEAAFDPELPRLMRLLIEGAARGSRLLFTSRVWFDPLRNERLPGVVGWVSLSELPFTEAVYLMETLAPLDKVPVYNPKDSVPLLTKRDIYRMAGGHPYTLTLLAQHARQTLLEQVLAGLSGLQGELRSFTLLEQAAERLVERARLLLRRSAVYAQPVPPEALAFLLGDERDAMPDAAVEVGELLGWGLLARLPGEERYTMPALVREWAAAQWDPDEKNTLLRKAAEYWAIVGRESTSLEPELTAREYFFQAGAYEEADDIVQMAFNYLVRWGQVELAFHLLSQSASSLEGGSKAIALGNLAYLYEGFGAFDQAREISQAVLAELEQLGDRSGVSRSLHQLGMLAQDQGDYPEACRLYAQSLKIDEELGDRSGVSSSLHQLGMLAQDQGDYPEARRLYEQSLKIKEELGDRAGVSSSLHQLGNLAYLQGDYPAARRLYEQSLKIDEELGDRSGVASSLHQLGMLAQEQGDYHEARRLYEQSLKIKEELGDRSGVSSSLHQLGMLAQKQGDYPAARQLYEQSLKTAEELGDRAGVSISLHQLGMLAQEQGDYPEARRLYEQSLKIAEELGDRAGFSISLHQLGMLAQEQGDYPEARRLYEQSLKIAEELGDRAGFSISLHQLGMLAEIEGELAQSVGFIAQALAILEQLGAPQRDISRRALARLREKLGPEAFEKALREAGVQGDTPAEQAASAHGAEGDSQKDPMQVILQNTYAALKRVPAKRGEWWETLRGLQGQATQNGQPEMACLFGALMRLVEGAAPDALTAQIAPEQMPAWQALLEALAGEGEHE